MRELIRNRARALGFDGCGFARAAPPASAKRFDRWLEAGCHGELEYLARNAAKRTDPEKVLAGIKTVITLMASYATPDESKSVAAARPEGVVARYARYKDYHKVIGQQLALLVTFLKELAGPETQALWYVDTGPVLERDWAQVSGLGFIGKHTNLISRGLGNWLFLSEILTDVEFEPDQPEKNHCGTCSRCLAACPTEAIRAPFQLDARRCISYLTIELKGPIPVDLRAAIGDRLFGCDDCLAVCPWNRFAQQGALMRASARKDLQRVDLAEILRMDEAGFRRRFAGTPIERLKLPRLKRNACVVLGNIGVPEDCALLRQACSEPDALVAEHAEWAMERIRQRRAVGP